MRFIHVGVGGFGRRWVQVLSENPHAEVVAMVDPSDTALAGAREAGGHGQDICFHRLEDAIAAAPADALVCSTPPAIHCHDVVAGLEAGLDVISEKPMADNLADCKTMLRAARDTGRCYCVSQNYRYGAPMWTVAQAVRAGDLGAVGQVKMDFYLGHDFHGGFRHDMPYPLIIDMSIHHFDLLRFITGQNPVRVRASAWNPPWSNYAGDCSSTALFEMDSGARVLYNGSWCAKGQFTDWNCDWQIECENGTVTYHQGDIRRYRVPELYNVEGEESIDLVEPPAPNQVYVLEDFMRAVAAGERPKTDVYDNIHSIAMVFATVKAMETGDWVDVLDDDIRGLLEG